jgi:hypothetical protein
MNTATGNAVLKAYDKSAKRLAKDDVITSAMTSAGFIIPNGQKRGKRTGYQVFVKVCRYSEELLKRKPITGGLLCEVGMKQRQDKSDTRLTARIQIGSLS